MKTFNYFIIPCSTHYEEHDLQSKSSIMLFWNRQYFINSSFFSSELTLFTSSRTDTSSPLWFTNGRGLVQSFETWEKFYVTLHFQVFPVRRINLIQIWPRIWQFLTNQAGLMAPLLVPVLYFTHYLMRLALFIKKKIQSRQQFSAAYHVTMTCKATTKFWPQYH